MPMNFLKTKFIGGIIMKLLDKIGLALFSTLILIISIVGCLMIFGWVDAEWIFGVISSAINNQIASNILLVLNIIFILLAMKCIFFESGSKRDMDYKNGILLENSDGKLLITKDTLENLVNGIVKGFDSAVNATTKVELDRENNVLVFVNLTVKESAIIKELTTNLQTKIKSTIKRTSDLEVKEVNVQVKGIEKETTQE